MRSERESLQARAQRYFGVLDTLDADAIAGFFTVDAIVRLPGMSPVVGRAAIRKALVGLSLEVDELHHDLVTLWTAGNVSVLDADVTLRLAGGTKLAFPATHSLRWVDRLIEQASLNLYLESRVALALSAYERVWRAAGSPAIRMASAGRGLASSA